MKKDLNVLEIEFIYFLYDYRFYVELECNQLDMNDINYIKSIRGNLLEMFEFASQYHDDERLTINERMMISSICKKLYTPR